MDAWSNPLQARFFNQGFALTLLIYMVLKYQEIHRAKLNNSVLESHRGWGSVFYSLEINVCCLREKSN